VHLQEGTALANRKSSDDEDSKDLSEDYSQKSNSSEKVSSHV